VPLKSTQVSHTASAPSMNSVPDAWDDEWSTTADVNLHPHIIRANLTQSQKPSTSADPDTPKKISSKVTKAQKRAEQAEFNRQLWAEAEGPKETNYFLESRNVVPLRSEFKPPTVLLSRKGPVIQSRKPPIESLDNLDLNKKVESSEDEEDVKQREREMEERKEKAKKEREEKQRKYDERRQELFGANSNVNGKPNQSGNSSPQSLTPPGSRSSTPNRGRGRGRGRSGNVGAQQSRPQRQQPELYEPGYAPKPDSVFLQRRENMAATPRLEDIQQPIRTPKGPDGTGRGGFGFSSRGGKQTTATSMPAVDSPS
jgi:hypothetical protein